MNHNKAERKTKLRNSLLRNRDLILEYAKQEWEEADKIFKRRKRKDQLIQIAKNVGAISGKGLLTLLLIGGVLTVAAIAPNIFMAYGRFTKRRHYFKKDIFNKNKYYFKRQNLVEIKNNGTNHCEITLTKQGTRKAVERIFNNFNIKKPESDSYWRVIMFDIPKKYNWARDAFRRKLRDMKFRQFQESVFITPYICEKEINFIVSALNIKTIVCLIKTKDFHEMENREKYL